MSRTTRKQNQEEITQEGVDQQRGGPAKSGRDQKRPRHDQHWPQQEQRGEWNEVVEVRESVRMAVEIRRDALQCRWNRQGLVVDEKKTKRKGTHDSPVSNPSTSPDS